MQQIVRFVAQRFFQELLVDLNDLGILVGTSHLGSLIIGIERLNAFGADIVIGVVGLTATGDTATATGHNLDEMLGQLPALVPSLAYLVHDRLHMGHTVRHSHLDFRSLEIN